MRTRDAPRRMGRLLLASLLKRVPHLPIQQASARPASPLLRHTKAHPVRLPLPLAGEGWGEGKRPPPTAPVRPHATVHFLKLVLLLILCLILTPAQATQRALLVGVSELINQPSSIWLTAPRNDVLLMRRALLAQGLSANHITMLADGVDGAELPSAARVQQALRDLLEKSASGDVVVLYFSGHGMRWRDPDRSFNEPDGLSEHFLARDARGRVGTGRTVTGDIRDVDIDRWIQAFLSRNVFVWAVFDTCSATSMTRSARATPEAEAQPFDDEVRFRGLRADQLAAVAAPETPLTPIPRVAPVPRARYVAFFASESHQVTPELKLPRGDRKAAPQGLLTWAVAESLARKPATWRDLFTDVLSLYPPVIEELERRFPSRELPSPVAEGALDAPLLTNTAPVLTTTPQWPAQRSGSKLSIPAGMLDGLERGLMMRVGAQLPDGRLSYSQARLLSADLSLSQMEVPASLATSHAATNWIVSPLDAPREGALSVSGAIDAVAGLSLEFPTSITLSNAQPGDLRIERSGKGFRVSGASRAEVLLASREQLHAHLQSAAAFRWLDRVIELAGHSQMDGFSAELQIVEGGRVLRTTPLGSEPVGLTAGPGQQVAVEALNQSGASVDLRIVGIDAQGLRYDIYPATSAETNRFESGNRERPAQKRFELPASLTRPGGRLVLIAAPARAFTAPRLFGVAPLTELADVRVRGQINPPRERQVFATSIRW